MTDSEITVADESCPYCGSKPFRIYIYYDIAVHEQYCDDCKADLEKKDLPLRLHEEWVIISKNR